MGYQELYQMTLVVALWAAALGGGISLVLVVCRSALLREAPITLRQGRRLLAKGATVGLLSGAVSQLLFGLIHPEEPSTCVGRVLDCALLGALLGAAVGHFVPDLPSGRAAIGGALGGAVGGDLFAWPGLSSDDVWPRLLTAALVGLGIGLMMRVSQRIFPPTERQLEPPISYLLWQQRLKPNVYRPGRIAVVRSTEKAYPGPA
jgi:hypothetical protein